MTNISILEKLNNQIAAFKQAIAVKSGLVPAPAGYTYPQGDIPSWNLVIEELQNFRELLQSMDALVVHTPLGSITALNKADSAFPGFYLLQGESLEKGEIIAMVEADTLKRALQTVAYDAHYDEPHIIEFAKKASRECDREINCTECDTALVWEHPSAPGVFLKSSAYMGKDMPLCIDCLQRHCQKTDCNSCTLAVYPQGSKKCRYFDITKNIY